MDNNRENTTVFRKLFVKPEINFGKADTANHMSEKIRNSDCLHVFMLKEDF